MSDTTYQSTVELIPKFNSISNQLNIVSHQLDNVSKKTVKIQSTFDSVGKKVRAGIEKTNKSFEKHKILIASISTSMAGVFIHSNTAFKKLEKGLAQIKTLNIDTSIKTLAKGINDVRKEFGTTAQDTTKAYYDIISKGGGKVKNHSDAMQRLRASVILAKSGNTDLTISTDILTSALNNWVGDGITATQVIDRLSFVVKEGGTTVAEMSNIFGDTAPSVQLVNGQMTEMVGTFALLTQTMKTTTAATGYRAMLRNLIQGGNNKQVQEYVQELNDTIEGLNLDFSAKGLKKDGYAKWFSKIFRATKGDVDEINKLFKSGEAIAVVGKLANQYKQLGKYIKDASTGGYALNAFSEVKDRYYFQYERLIQTLSIFSEGIVAAIAPSLTKLVKSISPVVNFFSAIIESHPGLVKVGAAIAAISTSISFFGVGTTGILSLLTFGISKFLESFDGIKDKSRFALAYINDIFFSISLGIKQRLKPILDSLKYLRKIGKDWAKDINSYISSFTWSGALDSISRFSNKVINVFKWLADVLVGHSIMPDMVEAIVKVWNDLSFESVKGKISDVIKWFSGMSSEILPILLGLTTSLGAFALIYKRFGLKSPLSISIVALEAATIGAIVAGEARQIKEIDLKTLFLGIPSNIKGFISTINDTISESITTLKSLIADVIHEVNAFAKFTDPKRTLANIKALNPENKSTQDRVESSIKSSIVTNALTTSINKALPMMFERFWIRAETDALSNIRSRINSQAVDLGNTDWLRSTTDAQRDIVNSLKSDLRQAKVTEKVGIQSKLDKEVIKLSKIIQEINARNRTFSKQEFYIKHERNRLDKELTKLLGALEKTRGRPSRILQGSTGYTELKYFLQRKFYGKEGLTQARLTIPNKIDAILHRIETLIPKLSTLFGKFIGKFIEILTKEIPKIGKPFTEFKSINLLRTSGQELSTRRKIVQREGLLQQIVKEQKLLRIGVLDEPKRLRLVELTRVQDRIVAALEKLRTSLAVGITSRASGASSTVSTVSTGSTGSTAQSLTRGANSVISVSNSLTSGFKGVVNSITNNAWVKSLSSLISTLSRWGFALTGILSPLVATFQKVTIGSLQGVLKLLNASGGGIFLKAVSLISKNILLPILLVYEAFKGYTDIGIISKNMGLNTDTLDKLSEDMISIQKSIDSAVISGNPTKDLEGDLVIATEKYTNQLKSLDIGIIDRIRSAIINALSSFIDAFVDLAGLAFKAIGQDGVATALKGFDSAHLIGRVIDIFKNIVKSIFNILSIADTKASDAVDSVTGEKTEKGFSLLGSLFSGASNSIKTFIEILAKLFSAIEAATRGDWFDFSKFLIRIVQTIGIAIQSLSPWHDFEVLFSKAQAGWNIEDNKQALEKLMAKKIVAESVVAKTEFELSKAKTVTDKQGNTIIHKQDQYLVEKNKLDIKRLEVLNTNIRKLTSAIIEQEKVFNKTDIDAKLQEVNKAITQVNTTGSKEDLQKLQKRKAFLLKEKHEDKDLVTKGIVATAAIATAAYKRRIAKSVVKPREFKTLTNGRKVRKFGDSTGKVKTQKPSVKDFSKKNLLTGRGAKILGGYGMLYSIYDAIKQYTDIHSKISALQSRGDELIKLPRTERQQHELFGIKEVLKELTIVRNQNLVNQEPSLVHLFGMYAIWKDKNKIDLFQKGVNDSNYATTKTKETKKEKGYQIFNPQKEKSIFDSITDSLVVPITFIKSFFGKTHLNKDTISTEYLNIIKGLYKILGEGVVNYTDLTAFSLLNNKDTPEEYKSILLKLLQASRATDTKGNPLSKSEKQEVKTDLLVRNPKILDAMSKEFERLRKAGALHKDPFLQIMNTLGAFTFKENKLTGEVNVHDYYDFNKPGHNSVLEEIKNLYRGQFNSNPTDIRPLAVSIFKELNNNKGVDTLINTELLETKTGLIDLAIELKNVTEKLKKIPSFPNIPINKEKESAQKFATGGLVSGSGSGTSDSINAKLSNGEYVVNANATSKNRGLLESINAGMYSGQAIGSINDFKDHLIRYSVNSGTIRNINALRYNLIMKRVLSKNFTDKNTGWEEGRFKLDRPMLVGLADKFIPTAESLERKNETVSVDINSGGGITQEGAAISSFLKRYRNNETHIEKNGVAASWAADIWLSGANRSAGVGSRLGLHSSSTLQGDFSGFDSQATMINSDVEMFKTMYRAGIDINSIIPLTQLRGGGEKHMYFVTAKALEKLGLLGHNTQREAPKSVMKKIQDIAFKGFKRYLAFRESGATTTRLMWDNDNKGRVFTTDGHTFDNKFHTGGFVSGGGTGTSDSIPAMLSNQEFVVNAQSTKKHRGLLEMINSNKVANLHQGTIGTKGIETTVEKNKTPAKNKETGIYIFHGDSSNKETYGHIDFGAIFNKYKYLFTDEGLLGFQRALNKTKDATEFFGKLKAKEVKERIKSPFSAINYLNNQIEEAKKQFEKTRKPVHKIKTQDEIEQEETNKSYENFGKILEYKKYVFNWEGAVAESFQPLKTALSSGGSIGNSLKESFRGLFFNIGQKFLEKGFHPFEKVGDNILTHIFPSEGTGLDGKKYQTKGIFSNQKDNGTEGVVSGLLNVDTSIKESETSVTQTLDNNTFTLGGILQGAFNWVESLLSVTSSSSSGSLLGSLFGSVFTGGESGSLQVANEANGFTDVPFFSSGGIVPELGKKPLYFNNGGFVPRGTDTVPAMLTPGEVVLNPKKMNFGSTSLHQTINISGNVDERAIRQIQAITRNVISSDRSLVNASAQSGNRENKGFRQ